MYSGAQTATEYLVILGVVIVIGLITVTTLTDITGFGGDLDERSAKLLLQSSNVGIMSYSLTCDGMILDVKNNNANTIRINSVTIDDNLCYFPETLTPILRGGESKKLTCIGKRSCDSGDSFDVLMDINYTDAKTQSLYALNDLKLVGRITSHSYNQSELDGTSFSGGNGSQSSPYVINNCNQLQSINGSATTNYYVLGTDIDCSDSRTWNDGEGFYPLDVPWGGNNFNGNSNAIVNLYINRPSTTRVGLFEQLGGGDNIEMLKIFNAYVVGDSAVGILVGDGGNAAQPSVYNVDVIRSYVDGNSIVGTLLGYYTFCGIIDNITLTDVTLGNSCTGSYCYQACDNLTSGYATV